MKEIDKTIFEYRKEKFEKSIDDILKEQLEGNFQKGCVKTESAGWVDYYVYRPEVKDNTNLPVIFNFHGGGFVLKFPELDGPYCQLLANLSNCVVINMDYAVAPEFKYPIPILSSWQAIQEILKQADELHIDKEQVFVCGHSAGGAIAADIAILNRDEQKINLKGCIVDYAPLKQSMSEEDRKAIDESKAISRSRMLQYINWYFDDLDQMDEPLASPVNADLTNLTDLLVISAEYDSLAQEEKMFYDKAIQSGVNAQYHVFEGCMHGFTHATLKEYDKDKADKAWNLMAEFVKERIDN